MHLLPQIREKRGSFFPVIGVLQTDATLF